MKILATLYLIAKLGQINTLIKNVHEVGIHFSQAWGTTAHKVSQKLTVDLFTVYLPPVILLKRYQKVQEAPGHPWICHHCDPPPLRRSFRTALPIVTGEVVRRCFVRDPVLPL